MHTRKTHNDIIVPPIKVKISKTGKTLPEGYKIATLEQAIAEAERNFWFKATLHQGFMGEDGPVMVLNDSRPVLISTFFDKFGEARIAVDTIKSDDMARVALVRLREARRD